MKGSLYLVPNLLGAVPPERVLPARTVEIARALEHWVVETPKAARAFLRSLAMSKPIAELVIRELGEAPTQAALDDLLTPLAAGASVGVLSDAGCPGIADPGAALVARAHVASVRVVPLVGPSSLVLALMASGMNGQRFAFHGYLPVAREGRVAALRALEAQARSERSTQLFIETPYRNVAMIESVVATLRGDTRFCVACDLTLPTERVDTRTIRTWRRQSIAEYDRRPAIFLLES